MMFYDITRERAPLSAKLLNFQGGKKLIGQFRTQFQRNHPFFTPIMKAHSCAFDWTRASQHQSRSAADASPSAEDLFFSFPLWAAGTRAACASPRARQAVFLFCLHTFTGWAQILVHSAIGVKAFTLRPSRVSSSASEKVRCPLSCF